MGFCTGGSYSWTAWQHHAVSKFYIVLQCSTILDRTGRWPMVRVSPADEKYIYDEWLENIRNDLGFEIISKRCTCCPLPKTTIQCPWASPSKLKEMTFLDWNTPDNTGRQVMAANSQHSHQGPAQSWTVVWATYCSSHTLKRARQNHPGYDALRDRCFPPDQEEAPLAWTFLVRARIFASQTRKKGKHAPLKCSMCQEHLGFHSILQESKGAQPHPAPSSPYTAYIESKKL